MALRERVRGPGTDVAGVLGLAAVARLAYGPGAIGYDASYAVLWGRELGRGALPDYESPFAPTPHPLANVVAAPLSWLGDGAYDATLLLSWLSLGALAWFAFRLGERLFAPLTGAVFALLLLTRPFLVNESAQALVDIPFLALVLAAGAVEAARPGRWRAVLVLLVLAGLLRPEGWGIAALYAVHAWPGRRNWGERAGVVSLAAAAPVVWALSDLVVTGDPLYSLHGTQALAEELERPRGVISALETMPSGLQDLIGAVIAAGGMAGALLGLALLPERSTRAAAVGGLGLVGFLLIGLTGLPVLTRYLLVPAAIVALFCAVALTGWQRLAKERPERRPWTITSAAFAAVVVGSLVATAGELRDLRAFVGDRRSVQAELRAVAREGDSAAAIARCRPLRAPEYQPVPLLAFWLDRPAQDIGVGGEVGRGAAIAYADPAVARILSILPREPPPAPVTGPRVETVYRGPAWIAYAGC